MIPQILKNVDVEIVKSDGPVHLVTFAERLGLDLWDWVACIIAVVSLGVAWYTMKMQKKTEENTMKITEDGQFDLLVDYFRHFYANLIVILAVYHKLDKRYETHYPSEEHFRKLTVELDVLHPEAFFHSKEKYNSIHNLYLLIRNFNEECGVAEEHVCTKNVYSPAKDRDMNTLIFKQDFFVARFKACIADLCKSSKNSEKEIAKAKAKYDRLIQRAHDDILHRAFDRNSPFKGKKLSDAEKVTLLKKQITDNKIPNYWSQIGESNFVTLLFKNDEQLFIDLLNYNVWCEIHEKNSQGYDKIFIIPFES